MQEVPSKRVELVDSDSEPDQEATEPAVVSKTRRDSRDGSSNKGKEEADDHPSIPQKTFLERVAELIKCLKNVDGYRDHSGLRNFEVVIQTTEKKEGQIRENLENGLIDLFSKFYRENRKGFLENKMEFLSKDGEPIVFGKSGKAYIPLHEIYHDLPETNPELIDSIDGCIYFVIQHVCPPEDFDAIASICEEFDPQEEKANVSGFLGLIGNIVGKVSKKLNSSNAKDLEGEDGQIDTAAVGTVVQDLIADEDIGSSMKNMMGSLTGEDFDINGTIKDLFNMANGGK